LNKLNFVNNYLLNNEELNKILNDPMYIFNSKFDTTNKMEYFLIQLTCIISLLHNNYNKHLMEFLLENNRYLELMDNKITYYI